MIMLNDIGHKMVMYQPGSAWIGCMVDDVDAEKLRELRAAGYIEITLDAATDAIEKINREDYASKPWTEISQERYEEMLYCLPPEKRERCGDISIFRMCEYLIGPYTAHFIGIRGRYFEATRSVVGSNYRSMIDEVEAQFNL